MSKRVYILGGSQTDFKRNWSRESLAIGDLMATALEDASETIKLPIDEIDVLHVGNFLAEVYNHQGLLPGVLLEHVPSLRGIPCFREEAACASGSLTILSAMKIGRAHV